ncbi:uncharacterized protein LOC141595532 [Silene latifolia]|uniref:uncharacterized protein LOC141595532 n=1 Tax=Silene latifolia TaxID=37657 RepID=UPI003D783E42
MVYAFNSIHDRVPLWDHLRRISSHVSGPWAIVGDFNCVLSATERVGGNTPSGKIEPFRQCVADFGVIDFAAIGSLFTWNNKQKPEEMIYSRIDRFLINKDWSDHLPELYAHFLPEGLLDHTPCIGDAKEFLPTVRRNWDKGLAGTYMFKLAKNLKNVKPALKRLNREGYNDIEHTTRKLQKQVQDLQEKIGRNPTDVQLITTEYEASKELKKLSIARDSYLAQKANQTWIKEGDTNSSYFHRLLKKRRNGNRVIMIEDMNGNMCDNPELVQAAFLDYYMKLLGTKQDTSKIHKKIIDQGQKCREEHYAILLRPITGRGLSSRIGAYRKIFFFCQDLIRCYERPNASPRCLFKIDLQKAYDTVEWTFVEKLIDELKFPVEFKEMGVPDQLKQDILSVSGFAEGRLPFKYLGMPIQNTRLKKHDCECLVEKTCSRIHGYGARKFCYAGRLVLVKAVLTSLHSYWACMFVIPKGILAKIEATCRNFLWDNSADYRRVPLVAWDTVCRPKEEGGLGIKNQEMMNKAMIGKMGNWIAEGKDSIWVKWVQHNHLKGKEWMQYKPNANTSWAWRRICSVKQDLDPELRITGSEWSGMSGWYQNINSWAGYLPMELSEPKQNCKKVVQCLHQVVDDMKMRTRGRDTKHMALSELDWLKQVGVIGDKGSIELLMKAFSMFSKATGLTMNKSKSSVYCNGMEEHTLREVELITGMKRGTVPFSYLGVTVSPKRLSVQDCQCLIDKVVDRIRGMGSRKLSYAGRVVLIKAVLSTLHGYWARIFILSKMVISICRRYLWHGVVQKESPALVSWANICQPKKQGGLGLKDFHVWNLATVGKYAWWVATQGRSFMGKMGTCSGLGGKDARASVMVSLDAESMDDPKAAVYLLEENCRNRCRVEEFVVRPCVVLASVQSDVKVRLGQCDIRSKNTLALEWVEYLKA